MLIADLRKKYKPASLRRKGLAGDPFRQFHKWFRKALETVRGEPNAMMLATADQSGRPSARTVLLKSFDKHGFVFYTNYKSRKGRELAENPHAALVFYWAELQRQVCIAGLVRKIPREESEAYFQSRPLESRLAAWVSPQSQVISGRDVLEEGMQLMKQKYRRRKVPLPPHWGGFLLAPVSIEFWQGRPNRLHDRFRYIRWRKKGWTIEQLAP